MSEGFALCEPIRNSEGRLVDYRIVEINPALQAMLGVGPEVVGQRLSDGSPVPAAWLEVCERAMRAREPVGFEFHNRATGRWHEIRLTRVSDDRLAQFFFDVTERKEALEHQSRLFDELNHRVKNSLTIVSGLLHLQARDAAPRVREELEKAGARVQAISDVHGSLSEGGTTQIVELSAYLKNLCARLAQSALDPKRVRIEVSADRARVSVDQAMPIGMIVNELVTNAAKHAYPSPKKGRIEVRIAMEENDLHIVVADYGQGFCEAKGRRASLGMKLVHSLVRQLGGEIVREGPPGTRFTIRAPLRAS